MEWAIFSIIRALFVTGKEASIKLSLSHKLPSVTLSAFYATAVSAVILTPYVLWDGSWRSLENEQFLIGIVGNVVFNTVGHLLLLTVIRKFEISYVAAVSATSPLIFGTFSVIFLGEPLSSQAVLFMCVIALGGILVELSRAKFEGFVKFVKESAWVYILVYLCIAAAATVFSKIAVTNGDPEAYIAFRYVCLSTIFFTLHHLYESKTAAKIMKRRRDPIKMRFDPKACIAGLFIMGAVICEMNALKLTTMANVEALTKFAIISTLIIDAFFISKQVTLKRWLGAILILLGGVGVILS